MPAPASPVAPVAPVVGPVNLLFCAAEFHGTRLGWQSIGQPRPAADAARLAALVSRIRPHRLVKVRPVG